ncbi:MAG: hypothetical protein KF889_19555 [Alphaproteobacteria bacterium]|nr:hypothetical protein [Alphaproteobacteria bacterium]MCW5744027.1 hypothetical protein [Alphaproteobacteria bacterium]
MYIQWFVKGIAGRADTATSTEGITRSQAFEMILDGQGIISNWWRNKPKTKISPPEVEAVLTEYNLDRHIHDYENFGHETPFISLASGCVERDTALARNFVYSAVDTALDFATDAWGRPGALFYGWVLAGLNPAVSLGSVAETVRDLNVYHRWSPFQLEGEITAKIHIPANQISKVEWWDGAVDSTRAIETIANPAFVNPAPIANVRELF